MANGCFEYSYMGEKCDPNSYRIYNVSSGGLVAATEKVDKEARIIKYEVVRIPLTKKQVKLLKKQNDQLLEMIFSRESDGKAGALLAQIHPSLGFLECVVIDYETGQKVLKATKKYKARTEEVKP